MHHSHTLGPPAPGERKYALLHLRSKQNTGISFWTYWDWMIQNPICFYPSWLLNNSFSIQCLPVIGASISIGSYVLVMVYTYIIKRMTPPTQTGEDNMNTLFNSPWIWHKLMPYDCSEGEPKRGSDTSVDMTGRATKYSTEATDNINMTPMIIGVSRLLCAHSHSACAFSHLVRHFASGGNSGP